MSTGLVGKLLRCLGIAAGVWLAVPGVSWGQVRAVFGTGAMDCGSCCQSHHCPPHFKICQEGPPRLCWQHGCAHPVANPCDLPHWGFFETCWSPYPWPTDWSHCPTPPPAAFVGLHGGRVPGFQTLPAPNMLPPANPPGGRNPEELPRPNPLPARPPGL